MSNSKISALTGATTPLAGTEVLPIVQSSTTKQVSVANLTAGRAISATSVTASTGNFVVGTSGQGIDFSATPGTGTSELLADYEEGTFTPSVVGSTTVGTASYNRQTGVYTKVGRLVTFSIDLAWNGGTGTGNLVFSGLPFTSTALNNGVGSSFCSFPMTVLNIHSPWMNGPTSQILSFQTPVGGGGPSAVPYSGNGDAMLFGSYIA